MILTFATQSIVYITDIIHRIIPYRLLFNVIMSTPKIILWQHLDVVHVCLNANSKWNIFQEPYARAYYFGPQKVSKRYLHNDNNNDYNKIVTYNDLSDLLTKPYKNIDFVFIKEHAFNAVHYHTMS